jgi:hypothetical protein
MAAMRIPRLTWQARHNVAALTVSFGAKIWETREAGDLILGYNATGRLAKVVVLDACALLGPQATLSEALEEVQLADRKRLSGGEFTRGARIAEGECL